MSSRLRFVALVIVMGLIGYGLFSIGHRVDTLATQLQESKADRTALRAELDDQEKTSADHLEQMKALAEQVERLGGKPVVDPANPSAPPRTLGPTDAQVQAAVRVICADEQSKCSPTPAQVKVAVAAVCAGGACRGEPGRDAETPADGQDATDAQVDAAVARYCGEDNCRGPGPTDQQLDERIAAYCSEGDRCRGEDGKDATFTPSGMDCPEGERVNGVHLLADGSLTVSCAPIIGPSD